MRSDIVTRLALTGAGAALALPASAAAATPAPVSAPDAGGDALAPLIAAAKAPLVHRDVRLARKLARMQGDRLRKDYDEALATFSMGDLKAHHRKLKRRLRAARRAAAGSPGFAAGGSTASAPLQAIAACESGGNPSTDTGNGFYGKYQFTQQTWQAVGGSGNPAQASEAEQDARAAQLYATAGAGQWPVCGG